MDDSELYATTMDPANRHLIPLTTDNLENTLALYSRLMGKSPALRRDFILRNKLSKLDEDDIYDDFDEED